MGDFQTTVSIDELRRRHEESQAEADRRTAAGEDEE